MKPTYQVRLQGGEVKAVADTELPDLIRAGGVDIPNEEFTVITPDGQEGTVPASSLRDALNKGYELKTFAQQRKEDLEKQYGGIGSKAEALALGAASELSFGLTDQALIKSGAYSTEELKDKKEANEGFYKTGEITGLIGPALLSGGSSLVAKGAAKTLPGFVTKLATEAGEAAAKKVGGGAITKAATKLGVEGAIESAGYEAAQLIQEDAIGDAELNAESLLSRVGRGAATGGMLGGVFGAGSKLAAKASGKAFEKIGKELNAAVQKGDLGVLKWAGAGKREIKKILQSESLNEKEFADYVLSMTKGFEDTKDAIVANRGITKAGGDDLLKTITTDIETVTANNLVAKEAAEEMMGKATAESQQAFANRIASGDIDKSELVFGSDIGKYLREKFINAKGMTTDTRRGAVERLARQLDELGVVRDELGNVVERLPMTPDDIRQQSIIFGELGFDKDSNTLIAKAARDLRGKLEKDVIRLIEKAEPTGELAKTYLAGKKLYQRSKTLDDLLKKKAVDELANNRGFSLTEAIMTTTGAVAGGIPGAVAAYGLRKAQREYGDIALTAILSKIGKRQEKLVSAVKNAADGFVSNSARAVRANLAMGDNMNEREQKKLEKEFVEYRTNTNKFIEDFAANNKEMYQAAPKTAQALQSKVIAAQEFLDSKFPKQNSESFGYKQQPSKSQLMAFRDYIEAIDNPYSALEKIGKGYSNPRYAEALKTVYPRLWSEFTAEVSSKLDKTKSISQRERIGQFIQLKTAPVVDQRAVQMLQQIMQTQGVQQTPQRIPASAAKNMNSASRAQSGLDKTIYRQ